MRRVMWFVPSLEGGGAERVCLDVANEMSTRGLDVEIVTAGRAGVRMHEAARGVRVTELKARGVMASLPRLIGAIRASRPDALVSVMDHANVAAWLAVRLARCPARTVFTTHADFVHAFEELPRPLRRLVVALYATIYPRVDGRVAVSRGVATSTAAALGIPPSLVSVIHNPIATRRVRALAAVEPCPIPQNPGVARILAIGRLAPEKDFETLLRAVAVASSCEKVELVILGDGKERARLEGLVRSLGLEGRVQMPGFQINPYVWLRCARVFVSSSRWEGFGLAILEAMALGVPVVATDCPSGPSEILGAGAWGRLVPVGDVGALADGILSAIRNPGPVEDARRRAAEFDVAAVTDRYLALMERGA